MRGRAIRRGRRGGGRHERCMRILFSSPTFAGVRIPDDCTDAPALSTTGEVDRRMRREAAARVASRGCERQCAGFWRHAGGACCPCSPSPSSGNRHGYLWIALARGGRLGPGEGDGQGHRQGVQDRGAFARSVRGGHRVQRRRLHGGGHRQAHGHRRGRLLRLRPPPPPARRAGAGPGGDGVPRSRELHLPVRHPRLRGRGGPGNESHRDREVGGGGRLRQRHPPDDRGRPGPPDAEAAAREPLRRRRPGGRRGARGRAPRG